MKIIFESLRECARDLLVAAGESPENAKTTADLMALCDAKGVSTHGTYLLSPIYDRVRQKQFKLPTRITALRDDGATGMLDGNDGLGQVAGAAAVEMAVRKAKACGIATVLIRNTNNVGALSNYTDRIAREGMLAYFCCNASPAMAPWGGSEQFIGTQPFAFSIYTGQDIPFSADMATSIVARGKIRKAERYGERIPDNWALDSEGRPTTDPAAAVKGTLLPIGGPKGSAIGLAIDIMAGIITGSSRAPHVKPIHTPSGKAGVGGFLFALDLARFCDMDQFVAEMAAYITDIKALRKAEGFAEILLPGEIELAKERKARLEGVDMDAQAVAALNALLAEAGCSKRLIEA